jgi:tetratricopeptide (TPR) repeat protein
MPQPLRIALLAFAGLGCFGLIAYMFVRAFRRSNDPVRLAVKWIFTLIVVGGLFWFAKDGVNTQAGAFIVPFACVFVAVILTPIWAPDIGRMLISPLTSLFDGGHEEIEPAPLYSIAESLRRRGRFRESIYAIQEQLQKFPGDFAGQMMIAEMHAENLNDLQAAELAIHRLCEQKNHPPSSIAFALNSLADWQLKYAQDRDAAAAALEEIIRLVPDSEFARAAGNRIAHLTSREQLLRARNPEKIKMPHGVEYLGLLKDQSHLLPKQQEFKAEAADLVAHLDNHPLDQEARERLAVIYARDYGRLDLATEQLEQLIASPGESPRHVARWLNLLADLQVHCTGSIEGAEETLQRIVELFPNQSQAELARQRLLSLPLELKHFEQGRTVKFSPTTNP